MAAGGPYTFISGWTVAIGFGMQILYDFAGYCHMAIGLSLMLGVELSENFLAPVPGPRHSGFLAALGT